MILQIWSKTSNSPILSQLSRIINNTDLGLYRDDGLIIIRKPNGPKLENYRKKISNALKLLGFKSAIHINLKTVNFLDITLNLTNCTYEPYKKITTHQSTYTHLQTTHPQFQNKPPNPLAIDYPATPPTSTHI